MAEIIEYIAIKSYTDIEQSKKLAKILPIESADMWHHGFFHPLRMCKIEYNPPAPYHSVNSQWDCPCWSLAALLGVIPKQIKNNVLRVDIDEKNFSIWYDELGYGVNSELPDIIMECPVDACVELIIKLHELKML